MTNAASHHRQIVTAAAGGDDQALAALVQLYHARVYRFGLRACRDGFDADDAVQEAFIKLRSRPDVAGDAGALSWLMSVVRNTCRRMLRPFVRERRGLRERAEPDQIEANSAQPDAALERWELVNAVHSAIAELQKPYREVLVLRDIEGLSGSATCAALGLESAGMKTRLHRARAMLRDRLARHRPA